MYCRFTIRRFVLGQHSHASSITGPAPELAPIYRGDTFDRGIGAMYERAFDAPNCEFPMLNVDTKISIDMCESRVVCDVRGLARCAPQNAIMMGQDTIRCRWKQHAHAQDDPFLDANWLLACSVAGATLFASILRAVRRYDVAPSPFLYPLLTTTAAALVKIPPLQLHIANPRLPHLSHITLHFSPTTTSAYLLQQ
jgi:hypothetical protein